MSTEQAGDTSWWRIPVVLRKLAADPLGKLEAWATALLHNSVAYIPGVQRAMIEQFGLGPDPHLLWRRGGRGEGDIAAAPIGQRHAVAFIENKALRTHVSYGFDCPYRCGEMRSQFAHMTHRDEPLIVIAPGRNLVRRERAWRSMDELPAAARVLSYSCIADLTDSALDADGAPTFPLLDALYDVEDVMLALASVNRRSLDSACST